MRQRSAPITEKTPVLSGIVVNSFFREVTMLERLKDSVEANIRELEIDGVTCLRRVLSENQLTNLDADIEACLRDESQLILDYGSKRKVLNGFFLWTRNSGLEKLTCRSGLPSLAAQLMRSQKVNLFCDNVFIKEPCTPNHPSPWHSDQRHWIVRGRKVVTFWIALDPVTQKSGAVEFIRGSHLWDFSRDEHYRKDKKYELIADIERDREHCDIIHYDLAPGDVTVHFGMTLHGASGNHTTEVRRRGYVIRYTGDDVVYEPNPSFETPVPIELEPGAALDSPLFPVVFFRK